MKRFLSNVRRAGNNESLGEFGKMKLHVCASANPTRQLETIDDLPEDATVLDLKKRFHMKKRKYYPSRQLFMKLNTLSDMDIDYEEDEDKYKRINVNSQAFVPAWKTLI